MKVTKLESQMITKIAHDQYNTVNGHNPKSADDTATYADMIIETPEDRGVFTSLLKKEYVTFSKDGRDSYCRLTDEGFKIYLENKGN